MLYEWRTSDDRLLLLWRAWTQINGNATEYRNTVALRCGLRNTPYTHLTCFL